MVRTPGIVLLLAGAVLGGGCATHRAAVASVVPSAEAAGARAANASAEGQASGSLSAYIAQVQELSARLRPATAIGAATAESADTALRGALRELQAAPTADNHCHAAEAYRRIGILDQAYEHFAAARALDPSSAAAHDGLARIWRDWGLPALGLADAHRAVYFAPGSAAARNTLGTVLQAIGRSRDALAAFKDAAALDPTGGYAATNWCYSAVIARDRNAIAVCERAVALSPGSRPALNNLALALGLAGETARARATFATAGDVAAADYNLGIVFSLRREFARAEAAFRSAVRQNPAFQLASRRADQAHAAALMQEAELAGR